MIITDTNYADFKTKFGLEFVATLDAQVQEWVVGTDVTMVRKSGTKVFIAFKVDYDESYHTVKFIGIETDVGTEEVVEEKDYLIKKTTYIEIKTTVLKDVFGSLV